jgi:type VI secretion system secreted protein VgrG
VTSLNGVEGLSELYEFTAGFKSRDPNIDCQALIGEVCSIAMEAQMGITRHFSGQIVRASALGQRGEHWYYEVILAPKLWHASRCSDFKIWQNLDVRGIVDAVLAQNALRYEWRLKNSYKTWEYLVQYNETDFAFISRMLEHEGIYYWFEHGEAGETLILGDHFSTHEPFGGYARIPFYPPDAARADEDHYFSWQSARVPEPGRFVHSDYDFKRPSLDLTTEHSDPRGHLFDQYEIFAYPGDYAERQDGTAYASARLEALQRQQDTIELEGDVRGAIPGRRFELYKHPRTDQNRDLLITRAVYQAVNNDYESVALAGGGSAGGGSHFNVKIHAIPAARQYRPDLRTPKPRTRGPETARVVGPGEIHTDQYGRVKVHFPWDRHGKNDGSDSGWIRVAYPWSGSNFGSIHIPRVGQEVIVDYEHGDPDRPIITGRVYNAEQMPPWDLPANKTQSGILTRSSPGGGVSNANALRFEDAQGAEQVWLHAERNQDIEVEVDETHSVGQNRTKTIGKDETTTVHQHRTETVDGNETITIHQNRTETVDQDETITIHQNRTETVDQNETITIHQNRTETVDMDETISIHQNRTETVDMDETITIHQNRTKTVDLDETSTISMNRNKTVGLNETDDIGQNWKITVGQNKNETIAMGYMQNVGLGRLEDVGLGYNLNVGLGYMINVGAAMMVDVGAAQMVNVGINQTTNIGKSQNTKAGQDITFTAGKSITLKVGAASLVMKSDGTIRFEGKQYVSKMKSKTTIVTTGGDTNIKGNKINEN